VPEEESKDGVKAGKAGVRSAPGVIGVVGAGTMGAGIAQLAARSGAQTLMYDPIEEALEKGLARAHEGLQREAAKGRLSADEARAAGERLSTVGALEALAPCELVIEAVPERLELKHELYGQLSEIVSADCVLATNTSSLAVTAIAAGASNPGRVVGMHFFNPPPVMRLLEVIAGEQSSERALELARAAGEAMGKTVIHASDGPGFLVNRCNRPFGLEALRMLGERIAEIETIDRICRMAGGFPMGPFELMDLVGVDVGFEISKSFFEQSFSEPRWRPSPITARYVAAGLHGRKTGRGYYTYEPGSSHRPPDPEPLGADALGSGEGVVVIIGKSALAAELHAAAQGAGYEVRGPWTPSVGVLPALTIDCDAAPPPEGGQADPPPPREHSASHQGGAHLLLCARGSLSVLDPGGSAVGFHALCPLSGASLVELTQNAGSSPLAAARAERFFQAIGKHVVWVNDAPGLVLGRIVCQLINEAAFALGEGVGSAADIDTGMVLGLNHPRGPLAWAGEIGLDRVLGTLEALCEEYREERYRPAPLLRRLVAAGRLGHSGGGFFDEPPGVPDLT
jgi:3-hydroxybutyryl-CoA dehydrogenase